VFPRRKFLRLDQFLKSTSAKAEETCPTQSCFRDDDEMREKPLRRGASRTMTLHELLLEGFSDKEAARFQSLENLREIGQEPHPVGPF